MKLVITTLLLFITLLLKAQGINNKHSKTSTEYEIKEELKRIRLKVDSSFYKKVDTTIKLNGVYLLSEKSNDEKILNVLGSVVGLLGLLTALGGIIFTYYSFQKEKSNRQLDFLFEKDKMLIDNPYLWTIYDIKKGNFSLTSSSKPTQQELEGQLDAFCYFHLNNFELIFLYPSSNKKVQKTWQDYMIDLIVSSTKFRDLLRKESEGYIYNEIYREIMTENLAIAEKIIPHYNQYVANSISRQDYNSEAMKILEEASR